MYKDYSGTLCTVFLGLVCTRVDRVLEILPSAYGMR